MATCAITFPITADKLSGLIGQTVTLFVSNLSAVGTLTEVNTEYVRIVDTNGVNDIFPLFTLSAVEYNNV